MNLFTKKITWESWKFGVLKQSTFSFGILMGTYFASFWKPFLIPLWIYFGITTVLATYWGIQAMFGQHNASTDDD